MKQSVPFLDLRAQYQTIEDEVRTALDGVLQSGAFILGPAVEQFEAAFAQYVGAEHAVAVNSGTSALQLALLAAGIKRGDEVIVPAMTFVATAAAVAYVGAKPVLVDIDADTYTLDPSRLEAAVTEKTRAIIPVHLYGHPADMDAVLEIARRHDLVVIEDAAQAHGALYDGRRCGSIGDLAAFSFYPGKNLGAYGEGGAVTTARDDLAGRIRMLRDWGQRRKYEHELLGFNFRMDGFQGAVLGVKLKYLEGWTERRRQLAAEYSRRLATLGGVRVPSARDGVRHVYHVYPILVEDRDALLRAIQEAGIGCGIHYPRAVHLQPCFEHLGYRSGDFPVAEYVGRSELSLPIYPELDFEHVGTVCAALEKAIRQIAFTRQGVAEMHATSSAARESTFAAGNA